MKDRREPTCRRSAPCALRPASAKLSRTPLSRPNSRNAARIDSRVSTVRVLRRNSSAQIRCRYFIVQGLRMVLLPPLAGEGRDGGERRETWPHPKTPPRAGGGGGWRPRGGPDHPH